MIKNTIGTDQKGPIYMTLEGIAQLKSELKDLVEIQRPEVVNTIT